MTKEEEEVGKLIDKFDQLLIQKDARINELLQTNNEYLERARASERLVEELLICVAGSARLVGQLAPLIYTKDK